MPSYCLDTNIVLALVRGSDLGKKVDQAFGLISAPQFHTISIVSHGELFTLADRRNWGDTKMAVLERAVREFVTVDVAGAKIVEAYRAVESLSAAVPSGAIHLGKNDIWIAATAIIVEQPLITTDHDFDHLDGKLLKVFWVDPRN